MQQLSLTKAHTHNRFFGVIDLTQTESYCSSRYQFPSCLLCNKTPHIIIDNMGSRNIYSCCTRHNTKTIMNHHLKLLLVLKDPLVFAGSGYTRNYLQRLLQSDSAITELGIRLERHAAFHSAKDSNMKGWKETYCSIQMFRRHQLLSICNFFTNVFSEKN